jgi:hypothetical protein
MKAIALLFIALIIVLPAVFARASLFYQNPSNIMIVKLSSNATTAQKETYPAMTRPEFKGLTGIYGVSVQRQPSVEPQGQIGLFGKSWLRKKEPAVRYPEGFVPLGGTANATPGTSKAPCADFGCKASQYIVADLSTKAFYRCWCEAAKSIKPENVKCLDSPGIARHLGFTEGKC